MASYTYSGPPSGATLSNGREVLFYDGKSYDLPADNEYVQALLEQKRLAPAKAIPVKAKAPKTTPDKEKV